MNNDEKTRKIFSIILGLVALALGITSVVQEDWSEFKVEDGNITIGPIELCITLNSEPSKPNCTSVSDLLNPDATYLDEAGALLITSLCGSFAGWSVQLAASACGSYWGAEAAVYVSGISDILQTMGISLFSTEDACNYGDYKKIGPEVFNSPFYISIASLILNVINGCVGKYSNYVAKKSNKNAEKYENNTPQSPVGAQLSETNI